MTPRLVTARELAVALGLGRKRGVESVYRWAAAGRLPHYRFPPPDGPELRFPIDEIMDAARHDRKHPEEAA